jgi:hypothetical protein
MVRFLNHIFNHSREVSPHRTASVTKTSGKILEKHDVNINKQEQAIFIDYAPAKADRKPKQKEIVVTVNEVKSDESDTDAPMPEKPSHALALVKGGAKTILKLLVEVADVFPPLKAAAAGVQCIVEKAEVS